MLSAKNNSIIATTSLLLTWSTLLGAARAESQPFLADDFDGVHSDSLVVRYRIAKQDIYKTGPISWCPANSVLPNQGCTTAVHRFCKYERGHALPALDSARQARRTRWIYHPLPRRRSG